MKEKKRPILVKCILNAQCSAQLKFKQHERWALNGLCVCVQPTAEAIMATKAKCMETHTGSDWNNTYTSHTVTYGANARLYLSTNASVCFYLSPEAFMLLIWQANQHSSSVTTQITIKTPPVSTDSTRKRYVEIVYIALPPALGRFLLCFRCFLLDSIRFLDSKGSVVLQQRWAASPPTAARRVPWLAGSHQSVASHWLAHSIDGSTGLSCCVCAFYYHGNHVFHVIIVCLPVLDTLLYVRIWRNMKPVLFMSQILPVLNVLRTIYIEKTYFNMKMCSEHTHKNNIQPSSSLYPHFSFQCFIYDEI